MTAPVVDGVRADPGELDPKGCPYGAKSSTVTATSPTTAAARPR